jgi:4-hydroxybenzoate polyprenyltransferase/phosphoserine phosphatase
VSDAPRTLEPRDSSGSPRSRPEERGVVPLVVDLDGTLISTDSLLESILALVKKRPWSLALVIALALRSKAALKTAVARRIDLSADSLPFHANLLAYLRAQKAAGRPIVLATAANEAIANTVATHLGLFTEVFASNEWVNLKGTKKRDVLVKRFGVRGYDYIGDSTADAPIWAACRIAHVAGPMPHLPAEALAGGAEAGEAFPTSRPTFRSVVRSVRIHQWVKNVLIFIPTLAAHHIDLRVMTILFLAFLSFSFVASGSYVINDLFDLSADRKHPRKSRRPFANGELSIRQGLLMALILMIAGFGLALAVDPKLVACLAVYLILATGYSSFAKDKPMLDVAVLALLYTARVFTGGIVSGEEISPWLFEFCLFLFLSLAFVKRYSELRRLRLERKRQMPGRGYGVVDLSIISQAGVASGLLAGLVLALYINGQEISRLYPRPHMLWGVSPLFVYWITRVWIIAHRGNMNEDPILYAFHDKVSYIVGSLILLFLILGIMPHAG